MQPILQHFCLSLALTERLEGYEAAMNNTEEDHSREDIYQSNASEEDHTSDESTRPLLGDGAAAGHTFGLGMSKSRLLIALPALAFGSAGTTLLLEK